MLRALDCTGRSFFSTVSAAFLQRTSKSKLTVRSLRPQVKAASRSALLTSVPSSCRIKMPQRKRIPLSGYAPSGLGSPTRRFCGRSSGRSCVPHYENRIDIVVPMVSGLSEILAVKHLLKHERQHLESKGKNCGTPRVGAMIEVPSAVLMVNELVEETDFLCLGTNDLIQYLLAADRDNEACRRLVPNASPSRSPGIRTVFDAANSAGNRPSSAEKWPARRIMFLS